MGDRARWMFVSGLAVSLGLVSSASGQLALQSNHPVAARIFAEPGFVIDELPFPIMDLRAVKEQDVRDLAQGEIPRFAIPNDVNITPLDAGSVQDLGGGKIAWRLRLECANAVNMNIGTLWNVPDSVKLYLLDTEGFTPYGAYTSADNHDHGQLWTPIVAGSVMEVYAELDANDWEAFAAGFTIIRVSTGYRHFGEALADGLAAREQGVDDHGDDDGTRSASCNVDVACPDAFPWCLQVKGAACYTLGGFGTCSGGMLNNVRENRDPIFMTANHCGVQNNPASIVVYWNFQNSSCRVPGSADSGGGGTCGNINSGGANCNSTTSSGSALIVTYQPADWTLTRLSTTPPDNYHVVYLGWDIRGPVTNTPTSGFGIHHPGVQEKRISVDFHPFNTQVISIGGGGISAWRVQYDIGGIEQGSSGSPLFNQDGRVVGTATAVDTLSACFPQFTWYGRLDVAYASAPQISGALDPDGTGAQTLNLKQFFPSGPPDTFGFTPVTPGPNATNVPRTTPSLVWGGACGADTFRVRLSLNSNLSSPIIDAVVPSSQLDYAIPANTLQYSQVYYWGITATNSLGTVSSTPVAAQFTVRAQPLGNFSLTSPLNGSVPVSTGPQLVWTTSSNALFYTVEVDDDPLFGSPISTVNVNAPVTQTQLAPGTLGYAIQYYWRVTAKSGPDELQSPLYYFITQSAPRLCPGDVTRDGQTNVSDFNVLAAHFGQSVWVGSDGDLNDDTIVNVSDFNVLAGDYGCGVP